jgi:hypothetical protein
MQVLQARQVFKAIRALLVRPARKARPVRLGFKAQLA